MVLRSCPPQPSLESFSHVCWVTNLQLLLRVFLSNVSTRALYSVKPVQTGIYESDYLVRS